ncbi:MAG: Flp family type IVb pilin [Planctomycetes bacterium]|nr:Flp family type IVb pilin [Planctomycetota bacterium]
MKKLWKKLREKEGQSLVEYALILALVAIVVIAALTTLGHQVENQFDQVTNTLDNET